MLGVGVTLFQVLGVNMDPTIVAAGLSAASNLAGGLISSGGNNHRKREDREAIYNSVAQKVKAARDWGVSPLFALGAPTYSPSAPVGNSNAPLGQAVANMGQDISRAVAAGQTDAERALTALALEKAGLENDYLRSQIASVRVRTMREAGPALPASVKPGSLLPAKSVDPQQTTGVNKIIGIHSNPYFSDAQSDEDRYGEIGGAVLGLGNIPADIGYTLWKNFREWSRRGGSMRGYDNRRKTRYYGR